MQPESRIHKQKRHIKLPSTTSEEFAEFYGAMIGDGCVYGDLVGFCITCNGVLDEWYVTNYLKNLCVSLFNIRPKIYYAKNEQVVRLVINSVEITHFLTTLGSQKAEKRTSK